MIHWVKTSAKQMKRILNMPYNQIYDVRFVESKNVKPKKVKPERWHVEKSLDKLWSDAVKDRDHHRCRFCNGIDGLNSHHIFTRSRKSTRWDIDNGITLCRGHHIFTAHKSPKKFENWLTTHVMTPEQYEKLYQKSQVAWRSMSIGELKLLRLAKKGEFSKYFNMIQ